VAQAGRHVGHTGRVAAVGSPGRHQVTSVMNSPAKSRPIADASAVACLEHAEGSGSGRADHSRQGRSAGVLRLAADAQKSRPGATEALGHFAAIHDALARQDEALVAFGKLLVAHTNDSAGQSQAINKLVAHQFSSAVRLDHLLQIELLNAWSNELAKPRHADPKRLVRCGFKVYSQCDEDGIIQEIFKRINVTSRVFVEFGVESGIECNSVKLLMEGWRGLWLDGGQQFYEQILARFRTFIDDRRLAVTRSFITAENINDLIGQAGVRGEIDLLSIDIDYNDYWVWKAINVIQPRVVVIEYNATLRPPLSLVVPYDPHGTWKGSNYYGASLEALVRLGKSKGYRLVGCNFSGSNAFFVRDDLTGDLFLDPATAEEHYEPARYYFGYLNSGHSAQPGPYLAV
jgi:hypothetical protein